MNTVNAEYTTPMGGGGFVKLEIDEELLAVAVMVGQLLPPSAVVTAVHTEESDGPRGSDTQ